MKAFNILLPFEYQKHTVFIVPLFFLLFLFIGFVSFFNNPFIVMIVISCFVFASWCILSMQRLFLLFVFYASIMPTISDVLRYPLLKYPLSLEAVFVLLLIFIFDIAYSHLFDTGLQRPNTAMDKLFWFFLFWMIFSMIWGLVHADTSKYVIREMFFILLYMTYFVFKNYFSEQNKIIQFWKYFGYLSVVISLGYLGLAIAESGIGGALIKRVATQHPHVSLFSIPFFISEILFKKHKKTTNIFYSILILIIFLMVFLSQQRALWIGVMLSVLLLFFFNGMKEKFNFYQILRFVLLVLVLSAALVILGLVIDKVFMKSSLLTFAIRINTLLNIATDESLKIRMAESGRALLQWKNNILLGTGLGSTINPLSLVHVSNNNVDNSYVVLLWKMGLIGFFIYLTAILLFFKHGLYVFRHSTNMNSKAIIAAMLSGYCGLLIVALTNSCLMFYRYNIVWAVAIATVEILYVAETKIEK